MQYLTGGDVYGILYLQYTRASQLMFNCEIIYFLSTNNMSNDNEVTIQCMY